MSVSRALLCALAICLMSAGGCDTAPTLPLPPPVADVSRPDSRGLVIVEGTVKRLAVVYLYNEETEAGVIGRADERGLFMLVIQARAGDTLTLWQQSGNDEGQPRTLIVPGP